MPTMNSIDNISEVSDINTTIVLAMDSFVNSSVVGSISTAIQLGISSVVNSSVVESIVAAMTSYPGSITNSSSVGGTIVTQSVTYVLNSVSNTSTVGDIRRLGIIGFDSTINESSVSPFSAIYDVSLSMDAITNVSSISSVQALLTETIIPIFTPVKRPVKSVSSAATGFKKFVFKDIALKGGSHPLTGDLLAVTDFNAVGQSIRNIVLTNRTERFFDDIDFGVGIESYLFEINTPDLQDRIKEDIIAQISKYESRAIITDVIVQSIPIKHQLSIQIFFKIKTTNVTDSVTIILERR